MGHLGHGHMPRAVTTRRRGHMAAVMGHLGHVHAHAGRAPVWPCGRMGHLGHRATRDPFDPWPPAAGGLACARQGLAMRRMGHLGHGFSFDPNDP